MIDKIKAAMREARDARKATRPVPIDNVSLPAGAPMMFYCVACGHIADIKPENYLAPVRKLCSECEGLADLELMRTVADPSIELFAWIGEDEFGSGEVGLKRGLVPAGDIPLVSIDPNKLMTSSLIDQMQRIVNQYKKARRLARFIEVETRVTLRPE